MNISDREIEIYSSLLRMLDVPANPTIIEFTYKYSVMVRENWMRNDWDIPVEEVLTDFAMMDQLKVLAMSERLKTVLGKYTDKDKIDAAVLDIAQTLTKNVIATNETAEAIKRTRENQQAKSAAPKGDSSSSKE